MGKTTNHGAWITGVLTALACFATVPQAQAQQKPSMRWDPAHSSNYTAQSSRSVRRIVIHTIEGSEAGAISWFKNPRSNVSAHFIVSHAGRITQMLRESDRGWHAGVSSWNADSIGIENEGYAARNNWTEAQYQSLAALVRYLVAKYRIPVDRTHIKGHSEIRSGKSDPGRYFNWTKFMNMVSSGAGSTTSTGSTSTGGSSTTTNPPVAANGRYAVEITASALNVRTAAWGTVLGQVRRGQRFVVTGNSGGWSKIKWGGRDAWVYAGYTKRVAASGLEVTTSVLNVRSGASTGYGRLGVVYYGQAYVVISRQGNWALIQYDGRRGWVHGGYARAVNF